VDLSLELQILAFYEQRKAALADVRRGKALAKSGGRASKPGRRGKTEERLEPVR
jgi:hypothetical protein